MTSRRLRRVTPLLIALGALAPAGTAAAATTSTVGLDPALVTDAATYPSGWWSGLSGTIVSGNSDAGAQATAAGTVTRWYLRARGAGSARLVVLHPDGGGHRIAALGPLEAGTVGNNTYTSSMPIEPGDLVGVTGTAQLSMGNAASVMGYTASDWVGPVAQGNVFGGPVWSSGGAYGLGAVVTTSVPPVVTAIAPASGPVGAPVTISGSALDHVTAVRFGTTPAAFTIDDAGRITATAPAAVAGTIDVTVVNADGTSTVIPAARFTTVAPAAPTVTPPAPAGAGEAVRLVFSAAPGATAQCSIDQSPWQTCASGDAIAGLAPGMHRVAVRITDAAGNIGEESVVTVTVAATPEPPAADAPQATTPAAEPAPVAPTLVSAARSTRAGRVIVSRDARTMRVACAVDRGALRSCSVTLRRDGKVVGGGDRTHVQRTTEAGVTVTLTRAGRALARRGGVRLTVDLTARVTGATLRGVQHITLQRR